MSGILPVNQRQIRQADHFRRQFEDFLRQVVEVSNDMVRSAVLDSGELCSTTWMPLSHDPADSGEDISMSSWVYGDPAPPIPRAYVGDPTKIRLIHGGVKETHVFHLHNHQWRLEGDNPLSTVLDSISISPQECYTLDILYGAGSLNGVIGDVIFHCQPPLGILGPDGENLISPTDLEKENFVKCFTPGALYTETCPCHAGCRNISAK